MSTAVRRMCSWCTFPPLTAPGLTIQKRSEERDFESRRPPDVHMEGACLLVPRLVSSVTARARARARLLLRGKCTAHRSCRLPTTCVRRVRVSAAIVVETINFCYSRLLTLLVAFVEPLPTATVPVRIEPAQTVHSGGGAGRDRGGGR